MAGDDSPVVMFYLMVSSCWFVWRIRILVSVKKQVRSGRIDSSLVCTEHVQMGKVRLQCCFHRWRSSHSPSWASTHSRSSLMPSASTFPPPDCPWMNYYNTQHNLCSIFVLTLNLESFMAEKSTMLILTADGHNGKAEESVFCSETTLMTIFKLNSSYSIIFIFISKSQL